MFRHLDWDSDFFKFPVACITPPSLDAEGLKNILDELRDQEYHLAYWVVSSEDKISYQAAENIGGFHADERITLTSKVENKDSDSNSSIYEYSGGIDNHELTDLAVQSGEFSRFKRDARFTQEKFKEMYRIWINRSITHEIADTVLVYDIDGSIKGFVTLRIIGDHGQIGLLSVDHFERRKNIGLDLLCSGKTYLALRGISRLSVSTQGINITALKFYIKAGFHIHKHENVFHFWLQEFY